VCERRTIEEREDEPPEAELDLQVRVIDEVEKRLQVYAAAPSLENLAHLTFPDSLRVRELRNPRLGTPPDVLARLWGSANLFPAAGGGT